MIANLRCVHPLSRLSIFLALSSILLSGTENNGVLCNPDSTSSFAFVGTLTGLAPAATPSPGWYSAAFHVTESLQGQASEEVTLLMLKGLCAESGGGPIVGRTYLVQTQFSAKGSLHQLEYCKQVRPLDEAAAALEYLRSSQKGEAPTELFGEVTVETRGYRGRRIPLPKTTVHLLLQDQRLDCLTDADGRFHTFLRPGRYTLAAEFPVGYEADFLPSTRTTTEHRCTQLSLAAHSTATITAHIVDLDGAELGPMSNVQLTLETAEDQEFVQSVWPDENSDLHANNLLPGKYVLGLNTYLPVNRGSDLYPPTYFPGVKNRSDAEVISLDAGENKVLPEMKIQKGRGCEIPVFVVDSLGKPSPAAVVGLANRDYPHFYVEPREQTDDKGKETVYAVFPGSVFLRAEKPLQDGSTLQSGSVEIGSCPAAEIRLKLDSVVVGQPATHR